MKRNVVKTERNEQGKITYKEYDDGYWIKHDYDEAGRAVRTEDKEGAVSKKEYNDQGLLVMSSYNSPSDNYWTRIDYDEKGREVRAYNNKGNSIETKYDDVKGIWTRDEFHENTRVSHEVGTIGPEGEIGIERRLPDVSGIETEKETDYQFE